MRCLFGFVCVLGLLASPLSVSAQEGDARETAKSADTSPRLRGVQRWHPEAFVDPVTGNTVAETTSSSFELQYVPVQPESTAQQKPKR